jgi:hypothetical protein
MRHRWVYRQNPETGQVEAIEVTAEREPEARLQISMDTHYDGLRTTEGIDIGSRRKHQQYMKDNGLTLADDYRQTWDAARKQRDDFFTGNAGKAERREAIERAIHSLQNRRR